MREIQVYAYFDNEDMMFKSTENLGDEAEIATISEVIEYFVQKGYPIEADNEYVTTKDGDFYFEDGDYLKLQRSRFVLKNEGKYVSSIHWVATYTPYLKYEDDLNDAMVFKDLGLFEAKVGKTRMELIKDKYPDVQVQEVNITLK